VRDSEWVGILLCTSVLHQRPNISDDATAPEIDVDDADKWTLDELRELTSLNPVWFRLQPATVPVRDSETGKVDDFIGYAVASMEVDDDGSSALRKIRVARSALRSLRLKESRPGAQAKYRASVTFLDEIEPRLKGLSKAYRLAKNAERSSK
jgi:hypothetical protein